MKRGLNPEIIRNNAGHVWAINLGVDLCYEHEWGIKNLQRDFGIITSPQDSNWQNIGIEGCRIRKFPKELQSYEDSLGGYLVYSLDRSFDEIRQFLDLYPDEKASLIGAWSEDDFGFFARGDEGKYVVHTFKDAFKKLNIAFLFIGNPYNEISRRGLTLAIIDRIPYEILCKIERPDTRRQGERQGVIADADEKYGREIKKILNNSGKDWSILIPKLVSRASNLAQNTRAVVGNDKVLIYYLKPMEKKKHNFGWFTVEALTAWARNEGPILVKKVS